MSEAIDLVKDAPLKIEKTTMKELARLKSSDLFSDLPGEIPGEKEWLTNLLRDILDEHIKGLPANPSKRWVMNVFLHSLEQLYGADTEAREHFGRHLELILDILEIESSDGLLTAYLS